ncbi:Bug family tripartite tricarboxylate transporter substrate binding protein [Ancylobacter terrae]|uniref:Bug family tripartite tricarboxylate transporter substrate binding protein n=1 Tax=Ancylobacter sp. sgz301288 TaxID=3342077 RepID=UPI00385BA311
MANGSNERDAGGLSRRACLQYGALSLSLPLLGGTMLSGATPALAQAMTAPEGPVEITVGSGPGATPDVIMRRVARILNDEKLVPNPIVVQNRTGGGWTVAAKYVLGHAGNKNILFGIVPTVFATPIVQGQPNTFEKVTPLAMLAKMELLVIVRADSPMKNLADFVAEAKKGERTVAMAGANVGSTDHIVNSLIERAGNVKLNYVPFDGGGGQVISALLGGTVNAIVLPPDEAWPLVEGKKAKAIAVLSDKHLAFPQFADVPTAREAGLDVIWNSYYGIAAVPDLDPAVTAWWIDKLTKMAASPAWDKMLQEAFLSGAFVSGNEAKATMQQIYGRFSTVLGELGLAKKSG